MLHFYTGSPLRSVKLQNCFRQWESFIFISLVYFRLHQVFLAACGLAHCTGFSCCRVWALGAWTSPRTVVVHRLCPTACGIFLEQGSNQCSLHWQADSYPLGHQRGPQTMKVFNQEWGIKKGENRTSLVARRLRLPASDTGDSGLIPRQGTKISLALQCSKKIKWIF